MTCPIEYLTKLLLIDNVHINNQLMIAMLLDNETEQSGDCRFVIGPNWNYLMLFDVILTVVHTDEVIDKSIERFGKHIIVKFTTSKSCFLRLIHLTAFRTKKIQNKRQSGQCDG